MHVRNSFENKISWKLTLFFLSNPVPVNGQNYQKQKGPWTSDQSLFRLQNKFRIIPLVVMYCMTKFDDVIKRFLSYSKNHICKFMQAMTSWHHKLFHFHWSFWIYKVWKGKEKIQKIGYLENEKRFSCKIKKLFFIVFEGLSFGEKIKIW